MSSQEDVKNKVKNNKWWNPLSPYSTEPPTLWRIYTFSFVLSMALLGFAVLAACWSKDLYSCGFSIKPENGSLCKKQLEHWQKFMGRAGAEKITLEQRLDQLELSRTDSGHPLYTKTYNWYLEEKKAIKARINRISEYKVGSIGDSLPEMSLYFIICMAAYICIARLALVHAKYIDANNNLVNEWRNNQRDNIRHHFLLAFVIFAPMLVSELCTSVFSVEKTWFGWDSYCVTPWAFVIRCLAMAALCLVAATPFSILLFYSDRSQIPTVSLDAHDGRFGVGRYADFISTWAMLLILIPSLLGLIGLRWAMEAEPEFNKIRLLIGSGVAVLIGWTVFRMVRNAIVLRIKITERLPDILDSHKPQSDPTVQLIGTSWWKLPATLVASLGSVSALLELSGLLEYIAKLVE